MPRILPLLIVSLALLLTGCDDSKNRLSVLSGPTMGTTWSVVLRQTRLAMPLVVWLTVTVFLSISDRGLRRTGGGVLDIKTSLRTQSLLIFALSHLVTSPERVFSRSGRRSSSPRTS